MIFIDETWAKTNMTRLRGRSARGERLIAALDAQGVRCSMVVDGAVNGDIFHALVEQILVPKLQPGDVVVMDNLSSHKRVRTRELIESIGADLVFLPPYSPDLNPIEMVFSKIKQLLRLLALRTKSALWDSMQAVLNRGTPSDATNCFKHYGYTIHKE